MTVQELIELSILDAMALLDEDEHVQFEVAFRAAAPAVQAQVRREQTRLSNIESLLPQVEAPAGLRALVLEAVRTQMALSGRDAAVAGVITPPMSRARGVSPLWRAGSLGMAAAAIVFGITTFLFNARYDELTKQLRDDALVSQLQGQFGASFVRDVLFDADTTRVVIQPVAAGFKGEASLFVNPDWKSAKFFCRAMTSPEGRNYKLAIVDEHDQVVEVLKQFTSNGGLLPLEVTIDPAKATRVAVLTSTDDPGRDTVLARGEMLRSGL
jgi:anti-sigma-K factor RskA